MRVLFAVTLLFASLAVAQNTGDAKAAVELARISKLPPAQRLEEEASRRAAAVSAYRRQLALNGHDCDAEAKQGQQPYNVCLGEAVARADRDFAELYRDLEALMASQDALRRLQGSQAVWLSYRTKSAEAAYSNFEGGTIAPAQFSLVYLSITRDRMRELELIYDFTSAR